MNILKISSVLLVLLSTSISGIVGQCTIDIQKDLVTSKSAQEPIFLTNIDKKYRLLIPVAGKIHFNVGDSALVLCASDKNPNQLTTLSSQTASILCSAENQFTINKERVNIADFKECKLSNTGSVNPRDEPSPCGSDGKFYNIGYQPPNKIEFVNLIDVCYSQNRASAIYSAHVIQGNTIQEAMKDVERPSGFKTNELPAKLNAAELYKQESQIKRLTAILGSESAAKYFEKNKQFLARGHLAPDADMVFASWQWSTYYYINVVPQWQSINNGNWKHVETAVRKKAAQLKANLVVFTGGYDVLELENKKITLEVGGLEVPKWTWKVVTESKNNKGIAFVTLNNPFAEKVKNLCKDICKESNWYWKGKANMSKGYTICCDVNELMKTIKDIPAVAKTAGILTF